MVFLFFRLFPLPVNAAPIGLDIASDWDCSMLRKLFSTTYPHLTILKFLYGGRVLEDNIPLG